MQILPVTDPAFREYGKILTGYDCLPLIARMEEVISVPKDSVAYERSIAALEELPVAEQFSRAFFGGLPVEVGYCAGVNRRLNALEYHRTSEVNVAVTDMILLLARQLEIDENYILDTSCVKAFFAPKGTALEVYATTLHYAPCSTASGLPFLIAVILPGDTNADKPSITPKEKEDELLFALNKWLLVHPDAAASAPGGHIGLTGENIDLDRSL